MFQAKTIDKEKEGYWHDQALKESDRRVNEALPCVQLDKIEVIGLKLQF